MVTCYGVLGIPAALFGPLFWQDSRRAIGKRGLPMDSCGGPYCAHLFCGPCALYQEMVYLKHTAGKDPQCCCYLKCQECVTENCAACGWKAPPPGAYNGTTYDDVPVMTQPGIVIPNK